MKICVIGIVGVPASYGGFETLVESLIEHESTEFFIYCSKLHYPNKIKTYKGAKLIYIPLNANGISSIFYDIFSLIHGIFSGHKNFLVLGVSGAIFFPILKLLPHIQITTNIDGIEWKREKWSRISKSFLKFSEYLAVNYSDTIIADNESISSYVSSRYKKKCKTIAYGGDHAFIEKSINKNINENFQKPQSPFAFSVCRIEPENNIEIILNAFRDTKITIIFIGNWQSSNYGKNLFKKFKNYQNIILLNPIYCLHTLYLYRSSCLVYIHGHSAGGTNPSLVEMMFFSKPIIAFDCSFNRATMENHGNYFKNKDDLLNLIKNIKSLDNPKFLSEIANRRYTWEVIRRQYLELFKNEV